MAAKRSGARRPTYNPAIGEPTPHRQLERLNELIGQVRAANRFQRGRLPAHALSDPGELQQIPLVGKAELVADQRKQPPFGSNLTYPPHRYTHVHATSGTVGERLWVPQTEADWAATREHFALVLREAGLDARDRVALPFSFGPHLQYWAAVAGVEAIGALAIPLGGLGERERLLMLAELGASALICTPSQALSLIEAAERFGLHDATQSVRVVICQGEPGASIEPARARIAAGFGASVLDHAGSTEVGVFSYPCAAGGGLHINEDDFLCEVRDPYTGERVAPGAQGELVLSALRRSGYPAIRFRSGDVVELGGRCPAGHRHTWCPRGIIGRTDDMFRVGEVTVFPSAIEATLREAGALGAYRIRLRPGACEHSTAGSRGQEVSVLLETTDARQVAAVEQLALHRLGVRLRVVAVMPGTLRDPRPKSRRLEDARHQAASTAAG